MFPYVISEIWPEPENKSKSQYASLENVSMSVGTFFWDVVVKLVGNYSNSDNREGSYLSNWLLE